MIEFTCGDCSCRVLAFTPKGDRLTPSLEARTVICATCGWIRTHVPFHEQATIRGMLRVPIAEPKPAEK
jgi:hypothetical protein